MVFVQNLASLRDVERAFGALGPRQLENIVEVRPDDVIIRRSRRQSFQAIQLALGFLQDFFGKLGFFQAFAQLLRFGLLAALFAQFLLDGAHLLA